MKKFVTCCIIAVFTLCSIAVSAQNNYGSLTSGRSDYYSPTQVTFLINSKNPMQGGRLWVADTADTKLKIAEKLLTISNSYSDEVDKQSAEIDSLRAVIEKYKAAENYVIDVAKERDQNYNLVIKLQEANSKLSENIMGLNTKLKKCNDGIELRFADPKSSND